VLGTPTQPFARGGGGGGGGGGRGGGAIGCPAAGRNSEKSVA